MLISFPIKLKVVVSDGVTTVALDNKYFQEADTIAEPDFVKRIKPIMRVWVKHSVPISLCLFIAFIGLAKLDTMVNISILPLLALVVFFTSSILVLSSHSTR